MPENGEGIVADWEDPKTTRARILLEDLTYIRNCITENQPVRALAKLDTILRILASYLHKMRRRD